LAIVDEEFDSLCLRQLTPVVRYVLASDKPKPLAIPPPLKVLGIISNPTGQAPLNYQAERENMETAFASLQRRGRVQLKWLSSVNVDTLYREILQGYHVLHYIGHGTYDAAKGEGELLFEGPDPGKAAVPVQASHLVRNLRDNRVRFVFLNACETGHETGGLAEFLVRRGVAATLGMRRSGLDSVAIRFADMFYGCLAAGWPIDAALVAGRIHITNGPGSGITTDHWLQPVLFMRAPDGRLFVHPDLANGVA
jgi:hypothetical protein